MWEQIMDDGMSWISRLQNYVAFSSTWVEYMIIVEAGKKIIWMTDYLEE